MKSYAILTLLLLFLTSKDFGQKNYNSSSITKANNDSTILSLTKYILTLLKDQDFKTFENLIHPTLGVRISLGAYVDTIGDVTLTRTKFLEEIKKKDTLVWGYEDGTGDSILMSVKDYFEGFANGFWLKAPRISANKIIETGNSINNLEDIYKGCEFSESNYPGFDKTVEGFDWCSMRMVFKRYEKQFYLVGIIYDRWTI